ncbi:thioredoxin domain-containing protein [Paucibacter sp. O1-1]|uniref:DsbA family protein n=1 Tax=Paucibacter sp. M5-1 TaxID=3015998 RepID=UPI0010F75CE1|nr:thioredoxin domain-containing protein [Paucibacter sp. M5-1]MCU7371252.1 thioredoxin domain-containing protein [Paucibacter sp. O1-1]MCZ7883115.1 thioredoxin domain-containing protein [Paucibacter sp. M5-1]MDA3826241.1 thioredoxin domain-containing protein [Paucibacter sp. O1-1]
MNKKWIVLATLLAVVLAFVTGVVLFKNRAGQELARSTQAHGEALVRSHSPVYGNPAAKVTIVEFFDPSCETCRAFYPIVKSIVDASFGQVRLVVRYAPLHHGSDTAVKILEAARLQGKYWEAVERALASQHQWASHGNAQPELIWELIGDLGLDMAKAKADSDGAAISALLGQDVADMQRLKVDRTPGFFVNGTPLMEFGAAQLKALVEQESRKAGGVSRP